jgi:hypothetical protein
MYILQALVIYCLPSMILVAVLLCRVDLRVEDGKALLISDVTSDQANCSAPVEVNVT